MANLKSIKKRIVSVKNTRQITAAMKMVSAAKLRRAQENVVAARPYAGKLAEVLERLAQSQESDASPLMVKRDTGRALLVVVTSDRGLCGGFNANLSKAAERFIKERSGEFKELSLMTIGRKGYEFLRNRTTATSSLRSPTRPPPSLRRRSSRGTWPRSTTRSTSSTTPSRA